MKRTTGIFRRLFSVLYGIVFIACILIALVCLGKFLYFPEKVKKISKNKTIDIFSKTLLGEMDTGHFHILDEIIYSDRENATMCLQCHGNYCHTKSEELRSFYNMHTFYLACESCHIRKEGGEKILFKWFDDLTGELISEIKGNDGSYGAKIVPVKDGSLRLDKFPNEELAIEYMGFKDTYSDEQKKKIQGDLMKHISEKPVTCNECHKREGYLNLSSLGYSPAKTNRLTRLEILKLLDEYDEFYMPTMFNPAKAGGL